MSQAEVPNVLVIDDDYLFLEIVEFHLTRAGNHVEVTADPREGLNRAIESRFDLILLDIMMPGMNGDELLSLIKPLNLQHRVVVVSALSTDASRARTRDLGAAAYIQKPVDPDGLCRVVDQLTRTRATGSNSKTERPSGRILDGLTMWVFENQEITSAMRYAAVLIAGGLLGVLTWVILA